MVAQAVLARASALLDKTSSGTRREVARARLAFRSTELGLRETRCCGGTILVLSLRFHSSDGCFKNGEAI